MNIKHPLFGPLLKSIEPWFWSRLLSLDKSKRFQYLEHNSRAPVNMIKRLFQIREKTWCQRSNHLDICLRANRIIIMRLVKIYC